MEATSSYTIGKSLPYKTTKKAARYVIIRSKRPCAHLHSPFMGWTSCLPRAEIYMIQEAVIKILTMDFCRLLCRS